MIPPSAQPPRTQTPPLGQVNMKTTVYCWLYLISSCMESLDKFLVWEGRENSNGTEQEIRMYENLI